MSPGDYARMAIYGPGKGMSPGEFAQMAINRQNGERLPPIRQTEPKAERLPPIRHTEPKAERLPPIRQTEPKGERVPKDHMPNVRKLEKYVNIKFKKNHELPDTFTLYIAMALSSLGYFRGVHMSRRVRFVEHNLADRRTEIDGNLYRWNNQEFAGGFRVDEYRFWNHSLTEQSSLGQGFVLNISCHPDHPEEMEHILFAVVKCLYPVINGRISQKPIYPFKFVPDKAAFDRQFHDSKHRGIVKIFLGDIPSRVLTGVICNSDPITRIYYKTLINQNFKESTMFGSKLDAEIAKLIERNLVTPFDAYDREGSNGVKKVGDSNMVGRRFGSFDSNRVTVPRIGAQHEIETIKDDQRKHVPDFFKTREFLASVRE